MEVEKVHGPEPGDVAGDCPVNLALPRLNGESETENIPKNNSYIAIDNEISIQNHMTDSLQDLASKKHITARMSPFKNYVSLEKPPVSAINSVARKLLQSECKDGPISELVLSQQHHAHVDSSAVTATATQVEKNDYNDLSENTVEEKVMVKRGEDDIDGPLGTIATGDKSAASDGKEQNDEHDKEDNCKKSVVSDKSAVSPPKPKRQLRARKTGLPAAVLEAKKNKLKNAIRGKVGRPPKTNNEISNDNSENKKIVNQKLKPDLANGELNTNNSVRSPTVSQLLAQLRKTKEITDDREKTMTTSPDNSHSEDLPTRVSKKRKHQVEKEKNEKMALSLNLRRRKRPETDTDTDSIASCSSSVDNAPKRSRLNAEKPVLNEVSKPLQIDIPINNGILEDKLREAKKKRQSSEEPKNSAHMEPPLCCCKMEFAVTVHSGIATVCRAVEYIHGKLKHCENSVTAFKQVRPSTRVKFMMLCNEHRLKMAKHQCCPGCGIFCSLGTFTICMGEETHHHFHRACITEIEGTLYCPHCGKDASTAKDVRVMPSQTTLYATSAVPVTLGTPSLPTSPGADHVAIAQSSQVTTPAQLSQVIAPSQSSQVTTSGPNQNGGGLVTYNSQSVQVPKRSSRSVSASSLASQRYTKQTHSSNTKSWCRNHMSTTPTPDPVYSTPPPGSQARMSVSPNMIPDQTLQDLGPSASAVLPNGQVISTEPLTSGTSRETLEQTLKVLESDRPKKLKFTPKNLYMFSSNGDLEKVLLLLADGYDPNYRFPNHGLSTALHTAASNGYLEILSVLIQAGGTIDSVNETGRTPLMESVETNQIECVRYLIKAGADVACQEDEGCSCLHLAAKLGYLEIIKMLLSTHRININIQDEGGWTPIIWAAEHRRIDIVEFLLESGADPNIRDNEENISLHWAVYGGCAEITEIFLNSKSNLQAINLHGDTPLHIAAREDHYDCVVLLLSRGANINVQNNEGECPVECAQPNSRVWMALQVNKKMKEAASSRKKHTERIIHRDISRGKENVPIPVVNGVDDSFPPSDFLYITQCCETEQLNIDMNIQHVQGCQCEDDCVTGSCICAISSIQCWYDKDGRLIEDFNTLDPPLLFECNRACRCWNTCRNRVVQHGSRCHLQLVKTERMGWGVRTIKDIPQGTFVCEYIGEIISDEEADQRSDDSYLFDLENREGDIYCLDARRYGNVSRFINHLCDANLVPVRFYVDHQDLRFPRIAFFTARDVKAYEQLGFDYGDKFWGVKGKYFSCQCGSTACKHSRKTTSS